MALVSGAAGGPAAGAAEGVGVVARVAASDIFQNLFRIGSGFGKKQKTMERGKGEPGIFRRDLPLPVPLAGSPGMVSRPLTRARGA
jgi:hypothetical protein